MKVGHIVEYHDVFFKVDNGSYHTMLSVVMAYETLSHWLVPLCLLQVRKKSIWYHALRSYCP